MAYALRLPAPENRVPTKVEERVFTAFTRTLRLEPRSAWLQAKGIEEDTARRWEVGAWVGGGMLSGCVAVRLHDPQGHPLGYAGRRLDPASAAARGKWVFPPRLPKSSLLYGMHRVHGRRVVVTECPWGVLRLAQLGIDAVGLLGVGLSGLQREHFACFDQVIALMDGDAAGRAASRSLARTLGAAVVELPDGMDPDDLGDAELSEKLLPFLT